MRLQHRIAMSGLVAIALSLATSAPGYANRIHTGGENGAYHKDFCPSLAREMTTIGAPYACTISSGTRENMERVRNSPREFGFGQLDVFALEAGTSSSKALQIVRQDDARECVFAVTRNRDINSYGELAAYAANTKFYLPPQNSGSAGTFQFLRYVDANGLGRAPASAVSYVQGGVDDAIRAALSRDDGVALFVQFPDPDNERFKLVRDLGGHFVPVVDRNILSQTVGGTQVYFAQDTRILNGRRLELGSRVTTACTPIVLFTGDASRIRDQAERRQHQELVTSVKGFAGDAVLPRATPLKQAMQRSRELTAEGRERILAYTQRARDRALPFIERMIERAAPRLPLAAAD